jgi:hypothetical protein
MNHRKSQSGKSPTKLGLRTVLQDGCGQSLVLSQLGKYVIVGEGPSREVRVLSSGTMAEEHWKRLVTVWGKRGYRPSQIEEVSTEGVITPLSKGLIKNLGSCSFSSLESLAVMLQSNESVNYQSDLAYALLSIDAPSLTQIRLSELQNTKKFLEILLTEKLPAGLRKIVVDDSDEVSSQEIETLLRNSNQKDSELSLRLDKSSKSENGLANGNSLTDSRETKDLFLPQVYGQW